MLEDVFPHCGLVIIVGIFIRAYDVTSSAHCPYVVYGTMDKVRAIHVGVQGCLYLFTTPAIAIFLVSFAVIF